MVFIDRTPSANVPGKLWRIYDASGDAGGSAGKHGGTSYGAARKRRVAKEWMRAGQRWLWWLKCRNLQAEDYQ
jgi:hypothetical protein